jgi:hypothetical protein
MGTGICKTCHGSGNILTFAKRIEYWPCPACGGCGSRALFAPPTFSPRPLTKGLAHGE